MTSHSLETVVETARRGSAFYRELYKDVPAQGYRLQDLPIVDQDAFWEASRRNGNELLTSAMENGYVFRSGGTTGDPKSSVFNHEEWQAFASSFGRGMSARGIQPGDRVANLFYAGDLYASFLFISDSLDLARNHSLQFPLAGSSDPQYVVQTLREFNINVIVGLPVTLNAIGAYVEREHGELQGIERMLFGGESMFPSQIEHLGKVFPGVEVASIGYASVDAGLLGLRDETCLELGEHRGFFPETLIEIVDEDTGEPIEEEGRPGVLLVTSLIRLTMPIIRYPAGDLAAWREPAGRVDRKFRILGRNENGARVGPVTLYTQDIRNVLEQVVGQLGLAGFQMVITNEQMMDRLKIRIALSSPVPSGRDIAAEAEAAIREARDTLDHLITHKLIRPLEVELVDAEDLEINARSGKLRVVIDRRHDD